MKNTTKLAAALLLALSGASSVMASGYTTLPNTTQNIEFSGKVIATACTISGLSQSAYKLPDATVTQTKEGNADQVDVVFTLTDCQKGDVKLIGFKGDKGTSTHLKNTVADGTQAQGTAIEIEFNSTPLQFSNSSTYATGWGLDNAVFGGGDNTVKARITNDGTDNVTAGAVQGAMTLTIEYN